MNTGMALPDIYLYYLAGQLEYLRAWVTPEQSVGGESSIGNIGDGGLNDRTRSKS